MKLDLSADYRPSEGEINNIVYLCCRYTAGWPMRQADLAVCKILAGDMVGPEGIERLVKSTCEYVWDHILGEPEDPSPEVLVEHMSGIIETWYANTTPEERADTGEEQAQ